MVDAFISTSAVDGQSAYHQLQEVVKTKRAMIAAAEKSYLLADSSKFGKTALNFLTGITFFKAIITGRELPEPIAREITQAGVTLEVARKGE
jgi:DeoR/GlpR family transcriptional regulator of sugar metabolism